MRSRFEKLTKYAAALGLMLPAGVVSALEQQPVIVSQQQFTDVTLNAGVLSGQMLNQSGVAQNHVKETILQAGAGRSSNSE